MRYLRLIQVFFQTSIKEEAAYRANFFISLFHSLLNFGLGVLGVSVLFNQVDSLQGWDFSAALGLMGTYLVVGALRGLFIGPGLERLAGMGQDVWSGNFDFVLLRPLDVQFHVSFRAWRLFALFDLLLGAGVVAVALSLPGAALDLANLLGYFTALLAGTAVLYAVLLAFTALVFWSPGFLFTWLFNSLFQLARYPVSIYPAWLRFLLTWLIPVGLMTTIPAQMLAGKGSFGLLLGSLLAGGLLLLGASLFFRLALRRYASASS